MQLIVNILESFLGEHRRHTESSSQIAFDCPSCMEAKGLYSSDGKGNLEINYDQGVFKCWACCDTHNMKGSIPRLIKRYGTSKNLRDYLILKPDVDYKKGFDQQHEVITLELPESFKLLSKPIKNDWRYDNSIKYVKNRGITDEIIQSYNIGYTTGGKYFNRVIIPSYDKNGQLNYFIARSFDKKVKPKYLNPDAEKQLIIFNEEKINWDATIYLVEGSFDHIVIPNSIPLLGKCISDVLKSMIYNNAKGLVVIILDDDAYDDAVRLYRELNFGDLCNRIKICKLPYKYDPSKIFEKLGNKGIIKLLRNARKLKDSELY